MLLGYVLCVGLRLDLFLLTGLGWCLALVVSWCCCMDLWVLGVCVAVGGLLALWFWS